MGCSPERLEHVNSYFFLSFLDTCSPKERPVECAASGGGVDSVQTGVEKDEALPTMGHRYIVPWAWRFRNRGAGKGLGRLCIAAKSPLLKSCDLPLSAGSRPGESGPPPLDVESGTPTVFSP